MNLICAALFGHLDSARLDDRFREPVQLPAWAIRRTVDALQGNLCHDYSLKELADLCGYSPAHFQRRFKGATGRSPLEMQREIRIERAMELLRETDLPIIDIAQEVGIGSPAYFSTLFKKTAGLTPSQYRRAGRRDSRASRSPR